MQSGARARDWGESIDEALLTRHGLDYGFREECEVPRQRSHVPCRLPSGICTHPRRLPRLRAGEPGWVWGTC